MKYVHNLPRNVREIGSAWIPMPDGVHLAARIWLPDDAEEHPVPAVLEYIPYRKSDETGARDAMQHGYFAGHGYAGVRVDLRGSGDSEGVLEDEYLQQELDDGIEVLRWLEAQPWCTGDVGVIGISWGGFNGLQLAAMRPPQLKAVITVCSSDDRYADDVHHMGGCLLTENLSWASIMFAYNACPPDPRVVGDQWRDMWHDRLEGSGLWLAKWLAHQRRDEYWKHGSICEDYAAVQCPVFAVSGWADGYCNAVLRMLSNLGVPRKGLIGPWSHTYPNTGTPGPAIGFLQECVRWWDRWLKGRETGIDREPMLRAWMQDWAPPAAGYAHRPGRWVEEPRWPSENTVKPTYALSAHGIRGLSRDETAPKPAADAAESTRSVQSPLGVGLFAGKWCSYPGPPDLPHDQRADDGGSLVFDSAPLDEPIELLGFPVADLELSADRPVAMVAVRLVDLAPDDQATRISYGLVNLTHRDSREHPEPLEPGRRYRVRVELKSVGQRVPAGHRLRLSVSSSYWPLAWPAPAPTRLTLNPGGCALSLPVRPPRAEDEAVAPFGEPEGAPPIPETLLEPPKHQWNVDHDLTSDTSTFRLLNDEGHWLIEPTGMRMWRMLEEEYRFRGNDWSTVRGEARHERTFQRGGWSTRIRNRTVLTCDAEHFYIRAELDAWEGDERVFCRSWSETIRRELV